MNLLVEIKSARELLMPVHYEIVQQIINRLSKYLSALKICIFHSFLFFSICCFHRFVGEVFHSHMHLCAIHFNISTEPEMTL